jgi:uncharacterized protein YjbI with pentapeptide repeats
LGQVGKPPNNLLHLTAMKYPDSVLFIVVVAAGEQGRSAAEGFSVATEDSGYVPPATADALLRRYAAGERRFTDCDLDEVSLAGATLAGAVFDGSWFHSTTFDGADLRGTSFRVCNVKCASFRGADLRGASFQLSAVEAAEFEGAQLDRVSFEGAGCYGHTIRDGDGFPFC